MLEAKHGVPLAEIRALIDLIEAELDVQIGEVNDAHNWIQGLADEGDEEAQEFMDALFARVGKKE
jgi:hypothetical protein